MGPCTEINSSSTTVTSCRSLLPPASPRLFWQIVLDRTSSAGLSAPLPGDGDWMLSTCSWLWSSALASRAGSLIPQVGFPPRTAPVLFTYLSPSPFFDSLLILGCVLSPPGKDAPGGWCCKRWEPNGHQP